jgi:hypothetical protein
MKSVWIPGLAVALTQAADEVAAVDKALVAALDKDDKAAINKYLDNDFTWIDHGVMTEVWGK